MIGRKNLVDLRRSGTTTCLPVELGTSSTIAESFDDRSGGDSAVAASAISPIAGRTALAGRNAPSAGLGDVVVTFSSASRARM